MADFAALESRMNASCLAHLANSTGTFVGGDPVGGIFDAEYQEILGVSADPVVVRENWLRAYDYATDAGAQTLSDHARRNDPFAEIGRVQVGVEISSVIRASPDSFRVAWTERRYVDGALAEKLRMLRYFLFLRVHRYWFP